MKKFIVTMVIMFMSLSAKDYEIKSNGETYVFNLEKYAITKVVKKGKSYAKVDYNGAIFNSKKGRPDLPENSFSVSLPKTLDFDFTLKDVKYVDIKLTNPVLPSRGTIYRNQDPNTIGYTYDKTSQTNSFYPENIFSVSDPFILRDIRGETVKINPIQFNYVTGILRIYTKIELKASPKKATLNLLQKKSNTVSPELQSLYSSVFINYNLNKYAHQLGENGEMLVLYTSRDASAIQPLIDWKRQKGIKVTTQVVSAGTNVKSIIKSKWSANNNILYTLLVGDWADIKSDLGTSQNAPMDPMLGCVNGTDNYPDLIVGRISANNSNQVTAQVNKIIAYEKSTTGSYFSTASVIASDEGVGSGDDGEGDEAHMEIIRTNKLLPWNYSTIHKNYQSAGASASNLASQINNGIGLINYVGHGSETSFVTTDFSNNDVNNLTNAGKYPFIMSVACVNGKFHMSEGDCFAEAWLRKENGGAIASIMSSINQPWQPPMRGQDYFNDLLTEGYNYTSNPGSGTSTTSADARTTFGSLCFNADVLMYSESSAGDDLETIQTWTIFGDPSIQVRTVTPKQITISNNAVPAGTYSTKISVGSSPVKGALVSLYKDGVTYSGYTDNSGNVSISHSFSSGTEIKLTVTGFNLATSATTVVVGGGNPNPNPTCSITSPSNGATFVIGQEISITATATDSKKSNSKFHKENLKFKSLRSVTKVDFYANDNLLNSDTSSPYAYSFSTTGYSTGALVIKAIATDNEGATAQSVVTVTISDGTTPVEIYSFDFESGVQNWTIKDSDEGFKHGDGSSLSMGDGSGSYFIGANSDGIGEGHHVTDYATSPKLNLSNHTNLSMKFDYMLRRYEELDHLYVVYRLSRSAEWITLEELDVTTPDDWNTWKNHTINLPMALQTNNVEIAFYYDDNNGWGYGSGFDNVKILGKDSSGIDEKVNVAKNFILEQNYPNPFNPTTRINYYLSKESSVQLTIYNVRGEIVFKNLTRQANIGNHSIIFDASSLNSGVYYYTIKTSGFSETKKMLLVK